MKVPNILKDIKGRKKKRDLLILWALARGLTQEETANSVKLTHGRISHIANANAGLLDKLTMQVELARKGGRLRHAFRILRYRALSDPKHRSTSKKDDLEWLEYIRKEIEGDKEYAPQGSPIILIMSEPKKRIFPVLEETDGKKRTRIAPKPRKAEGQ